MPEITYDDKDKTSEDPILSKFRDLDANEIKTVVNWIVTNFLGPDFAEDLQINIVAGKTLTFSAIDGTKEVRLDCDNSEFPYFEIRVKESGVSGEMIISFNSSTGGITINDGRVTKKGVISLGYGETDETSTDGNYDDKLPTSLMIVQEAINLFVKKSLDQDSYFETSRAGYTDFYREVFESVTGESWWESKYVDENGSTYVLSAGNNSDSTKGRTKITLGSDFIELEFDGNGSLQTNRVRVSKDGVIIRGKQLVESSGALQHNGYATLIAGEKVVPSNAITADSIVECILVQKGGISLPVGVGVDKTDHVVGVSFTIKSESVSDTSIYFWRIIEVI